MIIKLMASLLTIERHVLCLSIHNILSHPKVGLLPLAFETLELPTPTTSGWYLPAGRRGDVGGLDRLTGRQLGALRSVSTG